MVTAKYTPVFKANEKAYKEGYRRIINQGSSRSSKTYSIMQLLIRICYSERKQVSVVSPSLPHLKKGARKDFLEIMDTWGLFKEDEFNRTDNIYNFPTGATMEFFGADDGGKVRGPGRQILFCNEGNLLKSAVYRQLAMRTTEKVFIDFNPADEFNYVYDLISLPNTKFIHSTYKNNLGNLSKEQVEEIESLQHVDENLWRVFGLGLRGTSKDTIYTHWKTCKEVPDGGFVVYGLDFGFNNPSALVKVVIKEGVCYVQQLLYESKLTTNDLCVRIKELGLKRSDEIYCDAAEPKTIEELKRAGLNAKPADKDVTEGIRKVKAFPLMITDDSLDLLKEIRNYKWKVDKEERVLDEPVKLNDHACDAMRYAVFTSQIKPRATWLVK